MTKAEYWEKQALDMAKALAFYAEPETYFAIAFLPDPPCGEFMDDFSETGHLGQKPGKRAREAIAAATKLEDENEALLNPNFSNLKEGTTLEALRQVCLAVQKEGGVAPKGEISMAVADAQEGVLASDEEYWNRLKENNNEDRSP